MPAKIVTREEMDKAGCDMPDCNHDHSILYLYGECHMGAPIFLRYEKINKMLVATCAECEKEVVRIQL